MGIIIIKKRQAPSLPEPDALVVEPCCDFGDAVPKTRDIDIGPNMELFRCKVCGELWRGTSRQGKPLDQCEMWQHQEILRQRKAGK